MKLVFLDIDGVLNSKQYILKVTDLFDDPKFQIDPAAVVRLNRITDATDASIVVSSTWRKSFTHYLDKLQVCMASYSITAPIIGMTPDMVVPYGSILMATGHRGDEIQAWLDDNNHMDPFIVIDDERVSNMDNHLVKTDFDTGLLDHHVDQAIIMLGRK
jgi:hypothetical protein